VPAQRDGRLFASGDEPQITPTASHWPLELRAGRLDGLASSPPLIQFFTYRTEQRILSNNTLHTSPAISIALLHFSLLTRTGSCFLPLGSLVSPHSRSAVHTEPSPSIQGPCSPLHSSFLELQKQPSPRPPIYPGSTDLPV
jgi:hypothetical protein